MEQDADEFFEEELWDDSYKDAKHVDRQDHSDWDWKDGETREEAGEVDIDDL